MNKKEKTKTTIKDTEQKETVDNDRKDGLKDFFNDVIEQLEQTKEAETTNEVVKAKEIEKRPLLDDDDFNFLFFPEIEDANEKVEETNKNPVNDEFDLDTPLLFDRMAQLIERIEPTLKDIMEKAQWDVDYHSEELKKAQSVLDGSKALLERIQKKNSH